MTAFSSRVKVHNNLEIKGYMEISNEKVSPTLTSTPTLEIVEKSG